MDKYIGKRLLILGGAGVHCKVVEAAKEMGVYTIVADYLEVAKSPAKEIADENVLISILDVDEIVAYCRSNKIDGVLNFCNDPAQRACQAVCEKLGLPYYGNKEQVLALTDKIAFKEMCRKNGVDVIPEYTEEDVAKDRVTYPVIVKPVDSRGSRGQYLCYSKEDVMEKLPLSRKESAAGFAIIEKYMGGKQDFTVTYLVKEGKPYLVRTGDRYLGRVEDGLNKQCICSISPSKNTDMYLRLVDEKVSKMLINLGLVNSPAFMQGFIDGDTVRFYDPGIRFPGANYDRILAEATGANMMKAMISFALTGEIDDFGVDFTGCYGLNGLCSCQILVDADEGVIGTFDGCEEIRQMEEVVYFAQNAKVGDAIPRSGDVRQRVAEIVIMAKNERIPEVIRTIQSKINVLDINGNNMIVSQFDPQLLEM